jgi:glycosyltransferase involved in cell wall biosynthesis
LSEDKKIKILYVIHEFFSFEILRLLLAETASKEGYEVHIALPLPEKIPQKILDKGFHFHHLPMKRRGYNLFLEIKSVYQLCRKLKPELIHLFTIKPVICGGIAAKLARVKAVVQSISGLGYIFTANGKKAWLLRFLVSCLYNICFAQKNGVVIFQNPDDQKLFLEKKWVVQKKTRLILGSGVDVDYFQPFKEPEGIPVVVLPGRMLWHKGVKEFVEAATELKKQGIAARFVLVGDEDRGNPVSIPREQLQTWVNESVVEWWGWQEDMLAVFQKCHIVCLPSYREGLPKVLLEAAACARPLIAANTPGCKEIVKNGVNGLLVSVQNALELAEALKILILNTQLRITLGAEGRRMVEESFSAEKINQEILTAYRFLLEKNQTVSVLEHS